MSNGSMAMNANIILGGRSPNVVNALASGAQAAGLVNRVQDQNALRSLYQDQGAGIASGDPQARNALAGLDPMAAHQMNTTDRQQSRQDQVLQMAIQKGAREAQKAAQDAAKRADIEREIGIVKDLMPLYQQGRQSGDFQAFQTRVQGHGVEITPDSFPVQVAVTTGALGELNRMVQGPQPQSEQGEIAADIAAGILPEGTALTGNSSAEQKIARLTEVGIPREKAILIVDGVLKVSRDPVSGEAQMVDARTGQPWSGASQEQSQPPEDNLADGRRENLSFGPTVPEANYQGAFGGRGFVTNTLNAGADAIGVDLPFPENQEATTALSNLGLRTKTFMQQAFPGRASVQLMQELEKITAQPNRIFTGEQRGRDTLEQTASMIESLVIQERRKVKNPRAYTPQMRAQAQANIDALEGLLADYQTVLQSMESGGGNQTSGGVNWRVVE